MHPLRIYLDSSDFSDISNIHKKPFDYQAVRDYLVDMRDRGLIKICFSDTHVIEAAPTSQKAIPDAMERFRTIKEICGKNCVLHPIDVVSNEIARKNSEANSHLDITRSDGVWMPRLFDISEMLPEVEQFFREDVEKRGRAERRKYLKNGKPTALWYAEMRQANAGAAQVVADQLPLSTAAVRTIQQYYSGSATRADAVKGVHASLTDLEVFGNWYAKDWSSAIGMSDYLREIGANFQNELYDARSRFGSLMQEGAESGVDPKKLLALSSQSFYEVLGGTASRIGSSMAQKMGALAELSDDPWRATPGLTCSITLAMHVARRSVSSPMPRAPTPSDFPDCYHAVYLPYFDIFRADSFTASVIRECKLPFETKVVEKFLHLPSKIEEMLAERKQATESPRIC
jgi:hypothetical protein